MRASLIRTMPRMAATLLAAILLAAILFATAAAARGGEPLVELDLVLDAGVPLTAPQNWLPILADAGFSNPTIRNARPGDRLEIVSDGSEQSPVYHVCGVLTSSDSVRLPPGREFSAHDRTGLADWVRRLKSQGPETAGGENTPFGLTPSRLDAVKQDLRRSVTAATRGAEPAAVLDAIAQSLTIPLVIDDSARQTLAASGAVRDELRGLSSGTALAALVRPAGLVLRPRFSGGRLEYGVVDARSSGENWPVGWTSGKSAGKLVPGLMEKQQTQDVEVPLVPALKELEGRIHAPFLFDYNSLALHGVDLSGTKVHMKAAKTYYGRVLSKVLAQAGLTHEARLDDAGQPFLWITTTKH